MTQNLTHWASIAARSASSRAATSSEVGVGLVLPVGFGDERGELGGVDLLGEAVEPVTAADPNAVDGGAATDGVTVLSGAPDVVAPSAACDVHPATARVIAAPHSARRHRKSRGLIISRFLPG